MKESEAHYYNKISVGDLIPSQLFFQEKLATVGMAKLRRNRRPDPAHLPWPGKVDLHRSSRLLTKDQILEASTKGLPQGDSIVQSVPACP